MEKGNMSQPNIPEGEPVTEELKFNSAEKNLMDVSERLAKINEKLQNNPGAREAAKLRKDKIRLGQEQKKFFKEETPDREIVPTTKKESPEIKNKLISSVKDSIDKSFSEKETGAENTTAILPEEKTFRIEKYIEPTLLERTKKGFSKAMILFGFMGKKKDVNEGVSENANTSNIQINTGDTVEFSKDDDFEKMTLVEKGGDKETGPEVEEKAEEEIETVEENIPAPTDVPEKTTPEVQKDEKLEAFGNQVSASLSLAIERHLRDYPEIKAYALNAFPSLVEDFKLGYEGSQTEEEKKELLNWVTSFCEDKSFFLSQMKHFRMEETGADEDEVEEITRINTHREKGEFPKSKNEKTSESGKVKGEFEMPQIEYDGLKDDIRMVNKKIQTSAGISSLSIDDFKSEYGKKRYLELTTTQIGDKNKFNKIELPTLAEEIEKLLSKAQIIVKEDTISVTEESPETPSDPLEVRADLELINKSIMNSKSFLSLEESDFKSKFAKNQYKKFKSVQKGKGSTYGKNELSQIGEELEKYLSK